MVNYQQVFDDFCREIIQDNEDTRNLRWKGICQELADDAVNIKINLLNPKDCIAGLFHNGHCSIVRLLDDLENAFYCLSKYALNLCRQPHRTEYGLLKTYTGYYNANILSVMKGNDTHILESMGYKVRSDCENADEFILEHPIKQIEELAFELFLSQPYYRKMKLLCQEAINKNFDGKVVIRMLSRDIVDIVSFGVRTLCEQIKRDEILRKTVCEQIKHPEVRNEEKKVLPKHVPIEKNTTIYAHHSENKLVGNADEVNDDDLYSGSKSSDSVGITNSRQTQTAKQFENPMFNQITSGGTFNAKDVPIDDTNVYNDARFDQMKLEKTKSKTIASVRDKNMEYTGQKMQGSQVKPPYPYDALPAGKYEKEISSHRHNNKQQTQVGSDVNAQPHENHRPNIASSIGVQENEFSRLPVIPNQYEMEHPIQRTNEQERITPTNQLREMQRKAGMERRKKQLPSEEERLRTQGGQDGNVQGKGYNADYINDGRRGSKIKAILSQGIPMTNLDVASKGSPGTRRSSTDALLDETAKGVSDRGKNNTFNNLQSKCSETFFTGSDDYDGYVEITAIKEDIFPERANESKPGYAEATTRRKDKLPELANECKPGYAEVTALRLRKFHEHGNEFKQGPTAQQILRGSGSPNTRTSNSGGDVQQPRSGKNTPNDENTIIFPTGYSTENKEIKVPSIYSEIAS